jgi:hypothetical protein
MKFFSNKFKNRLWIFGTSALITAVLLVSFQSLIYAANLETKDRQAEKLQTVKTAEWNTVNVVIKDTIDKAGKKLDTEIIPSILADITKTYGKDSERLKHDLQSFSDKKYDNPLIHLLANHINQKYMYDIKSDSNDIFILTKKDGIISDPSISTSSIDRPRSLELEIASHYNTKLATEAFAAITDQTRRVNNPIIFWQFFQPQNTTEKKLTTMDLSQLKSAFESRDGNLSVLDSYEFLVPRYIFFDHDLLGNKLVDDRGVRQDIYQIVLVQGFNAAEIIQQTDLLSSIYKGITIDRTSNLNFLSISRIIQILLCMSTFTIIAWVQFAVKARRKYVDEDNLGNILPT